MQRGKKTMGSEHESCLFATGATVLPIRIPTPGQHGGCLLLLRDRSAIPFRQPAGLH
jgi:hypothetical protein